MDTQTPSLPGQDGQAPLPEADQALDHLNQVKAHFRNLVARTQQQAHDLQQAQQEAQLLRTKLHGLETANSDLAQRLRESQNQVAQAQAQAQRML